MALLTRWRGHVMAPVHIRFDRCLYAVSLLILISLAVIVILQKKTNSLTENEQGSFAGVDLAAKQAEDKEEKSKQTADEASIQCETIVSQPQAATQHYKHHQQADVLGGDLFPVKSSDVEVLKKVCSALEDCKGFNTNGWLKQSIGQMYKTNIDLYVKETQPVDETVYLSSKVIEENYGKDYLRMVQNFKIYIYDIQAGEDIKSPRDFKYGVEKLFIDLLSQSSFRTLNPEEADLFFIPMRCTAYRKAVADYQTAVEFAQDTAKAILDKIKSSHPYWSRTLGADHFYVCAHDIGAGIAARADHNLLKNAIALVNTADYEDNYYVPHKDISLPPHPSHGHNSLPDIGKGGHSLDPADRTILIFFSGTLDRGRIRPTVKARWSADPDFKIFEGIMEIEKYVGYLKKAKFCLLPRGNRAWSPRLMDAVWFGCVPAILSDNYDLPLQGLIDWTQFSIFIPEAQVDFLKERIQSVTDTELSAMQTRLRQVYAHLTWNKPPKPYDAFHSVLFQLWKKRHIVKYKEII